MSNGRSFSRKRRSSPGKSVRKNQKSMRSSAGMQRNIEKLGKLASEAITSALEKPSDEVK